jgi:hypothetical protein
MRMIWVVRLGFGCEFWHVHALTSDCLEEIDAQRVLGYALFKDGKNARLPYPLEKFSSDVAGRSFHNGRFIRRMREKAATLPKYSFLPSYFPVAYIYIYIYIYIAC